MGQAAMEPYLLQLTLPPNNVHPGDHVLAEVTIHANRDVSFDQPLVMLVKRPDELSIDPTFEPATKEEPIADLPTQLKRGETFHKSIPFTAPAQPGYYQFNVDGQHRAHGQFPSGTPPMTLYVAYDSSSLRLGTLQINKSTMVNKHTFVVKQITMGTENTKIAVNISNPTYNQGLYFKLLDQDGKQIQTLKPVSNLGGNGNDTLTFAPIPKTVKRLQFVVTKFENATKPNVFAT
ncbi:MAG: hypothetical protein ACXVP5_07515 [Tumebacillaceae bacterium]